MRRVHHRILGLLASAFAAWHCASVRGADFPLSEGETIVGALRVIELQSNSTLYDVARHFDLGTPELAAPNPGVDLWAPTQRQRLLVPTEFILPPKPWVGIVVNLAARRLFYFPSPSPGQAATVMTVPIGIGAEYWLTPVGRTVISAKIRDPVWIPPPDIRAEHATLGDVLPAVVPPGPNNPMGLFELATGFAGIYIHGTNRPWSVGGIASHGCIRLYPEDVAELFRRVPLGTPVRIIDQPYRFGSLGGETYLAASPLFQKSQTGIVPAQDVVSAWIAYSSGRQLAVDWDRLMEVAKRAQGVPIPIAPGSRSLADETTNAAAEPYRFRAYGADANNAAMPQSPEH